MGRLAVVFSPFHALTGSFAAPTFARSFSPATITKGQSAMSLYAPAEWAPHRAIWVGFPSHADLWQDDLDPAQQEVAALARALAGPGGERVRLLVCGDEAV